MNLVDTSVVIDFLRGSAPAVAAVADAQAAGELAASEITRFEVLACMWPDEQDPTEDFFGLLDVYPVDETVARRAAEFAQRHRAANQGIEDADYLIAATAAELDATLLTTNVRHFPMFPGLAPAY
jgi:predicted nucleic acid-binding protein